MRGMTERIPKRRNRLNKKRMINDLLMECITILRRSEDHEVAFNKLLGLVASFYGADRAYVFGFDLVSRRMNNTYEWCAEGIEPEMDGLEAAAAIRAPDRPDAWRTDP